MHLVLRFLEVQTRSSSSHGWQACSSLGLTCWHMHGRSTHLQGACRRWQPSPFSLGCTGEASIDGLAWMLRRS